VVAVVTGAAGFIGSAVCRRLLADGETVRGIDCLTKTYDVEQKMGNISPLIDHPSFNLLYADLASSDIDPILEGADTIYHLAGQASVSRSWGVPFADYTRNNIDATQRLLEACADRSLRKVVHASSSSVYGDAEVRPTPETVLPRPVSPYGVTKLAAEHLCHVYHHNRGVPTAALRLFTVYGPGQRPDMAFHRLVRAALERQPFMVNGDGFQSRDFTHVNDVVDAVVAAARSSWTGVANIGGGSSTTLREVIAVVEQQCGPVEIIYGPPTAGDATHTSADITLAHSEIGYRPAMTISDGIATMVAWARERASEREASVRQ
jgi:nucleoside-diphosphate-sugar epimerase